ncbi:MAG TPA: LPXTG cell wall anchor domain-containing protein [Bdellovibrionota bacterium]|jgi:LPXTG-motif cell wall-anchored protein
MFLLAFFILTSAASATTFGPIPVVVQAQQSQYVVRGKILGASWTKEAPDTRRPYTYWKVAIAEQLVGDALPSEIEIRQPGGELGGLGYHVAGTADFNPNEDAFLLLHDTDEHPGTKEVVGLASGKYRVTKGPGGKPIVESGLGLTVKGADGQPFSPEEFTALMRRVQDRKTTAEDQSIFVNKTPVHEREENLAQQEAEKISAPSRKLSSSDKSESAPVISPNPVQESPAETEESSTGPSVNTWALAAGALVGFLLGIYLFLRRR